MRMILRIPRVLSIALMASLMVISCVPLRKVNYVQESEEMATLRQDNLYFVDEAVDNTIKQGDELYIKVTSADESMTNFNQNRLDSRGDPSLISYTVDSDGTIKLPYINQINLVGLTLEEASFKIEEELSQYLLYPSVFIRYVNNKVTILGEVNNPGVYVFNYKSINILQAIGYANDVATFGNRQKVLIIREEGNIRSRNYVDLTSDELLASDLYMIKSNDIIYVEPLRSKKWDMATIPYNLILSITSLTITIMTFYITYILNS